MKKLIKGIVEFRNHSMVEYQKKFSHLALGQAPDTLFIACCDSRVEPNVLSSTHPGDIFVLRNIGNIVPPYALASQGTETHRDVSAAAALEFAVKTLHVSHIVVFGHSECAAMCSCLSEHILDQNDPNVDTDEEPHTFLHEWLQYAIPSYQRFRAQATIDPNFSPQNTLSRINVVQQLDHLRSYPWITEQIYAGKLHIHGLWFDLATADVHYYDEHAEQFMILEGDFAEIVLQRIC